MVSTWGRVSREVRPERQEGTRLWRALKIKQNFIFDLGGNRELLNKEVTWSDFDFRKVI